MKKQNLYSLLVIFLAFSFGVFAQTPAFPTAEGYGKFAKGGRGGQVVFVENLNDYIAYNNMEAPIPGSFRWALTQYPGQPLTVIFRVSGTIMLKPYLVSGKNMNDIRCQRPNLTIAGQTAPGEGICIRNSKVNLGGSVDLIVRNMRFRIGENAVDSTFIPGGSVGIENATNVILDHCVFGWSGEENITMYDNKFTSVQWSVMHEGLYDDGHGKGNRSYGGQCGGANATWHHNLFAHNYSRSPRLNGARTDNEVKVFIEFINNVNYNWGRSGAPYGGELFVGAIRSHTANYANNYFKPGPGTDGTKYFFNLNIVSGANAPKWYVNGNTMVGSASLTANNWDGMANKPSDLSTIKSDTLLYPPLANTYLGKWIGYEPYRINMQSADDAYQSVLDKVGTVNRDSVERRIIREVKTGTSIFKASQGKWGIIDHSYNAEGFLNYPVASAPVDNDNDGMADDWEVANGLNPANPDDRNLLTVEGYTALEVYLNSLMGEHINPEFLPAAVNDVKQFQTSIYPTTVKDNITIDADSPIRLITIFSVNGEKLYTSVLNPVNTLNVSFLTKGCYVLKVDSRNGYYTHSKFFKE